MPQASVKRAGRFAFVAAALVLVNLATAVVSAAGTSTSLAGIVPPRNPPKNLAPAPDFYASCTPNVLDDTVACNSKVLEAIDHARSSEPVGPLQFNLEKFLRLSVADQLFAVVDLERVSRDEPPVTALVAQLDQVGKAGALAGGDPVLAAASLAGGAQVRAWGSNWAAGSESALGADYSWMYDDGYGSSNYACRSPHAEGCWGHRDNILRLWPSYLAGCKPGDSQLVMGAAQANSSRYGTSFAEIFVAACGPKPTGEVYTWAQAQAATGAQRP